MPVIGALNCCFLKIIGVLSESVSGLKDFFENLFVSLYMNPPFPKGPSCYPAAANIHTVGILALHLLRTSKDS